jgi:hypothetical protein
MTDCRGCSRFSQESRTPLGIGQILGVKNFHRDETIEPLVAREINRPHAALTKDADNVESINVLWKVGHGVDIVLDGRVVNFLTPPRG